MGDCDLDLDRGDRIGDRVPKSSISLVSYVIALFITS
jgi:hypothetical protein